MLFRIMALVMAAIAVSIGFNVDSEHAFSAVLLPATAAFGLAMLAND